MEGKGKRNIIDIVGIGLDVMLYYTPEGLAIFRMELESYLNDKGWLQRFRRKR